MPPKRPSPRLEFDIPDNVEELVRRRYPGVCRVRDDVSLGKVPYQLVGEILDYIPNTRSSRCEVVNGSVSVTRDGFPDLTYSFCAHDRNYCRRHDWRLLNQRWHTGYWARVEHVILRQGSRGLPSIAQFFQLHPMLYSLRGVEIDGPTPPRDVLLPLETLGLRQIYLPRYIGDSTASTTRSNSMNINQFHDVGLYRPSAIHVTQHSPDRFIEGALRRTITMEKSSYSFTYADSNEDTEITYDASIRKETEQTRFASVIRYVRYIEVENIICIGGCPMTVFEKWIKWLECGPREHISIVLDLNKMWELDEMYGFGKYLVARGWKRRCENESTDEGVTYELDANARWLKERDAYVNRIMGLR